MGNGLKHIKYKRINKKKEELIKIKNTQCLLAEIVQIQILFLDCDIILLRKIEALNYNNNIKMSNIVIVESPAKCGKIQKYLGDNFKVLASCGHIRKLQPTIDAVGIYKNFEPTYEFIKEKGDVIKKLKDVVKSYGVKVFIATDDDREGEGIARDLMILLGLDSKTTPRIVFHEITETAVKKAVLNPQLLNLNKASSQEARTILDQLIGFTISPLLWKHISPALSAGRCQTVALRLLKDKEDEIINFNPTTTWKIKGKWVTKDGFEFDTMLKDELEDEESVLNYLEQVHSSPGGVVMEATTKPFSEKAPLPLITSTLQQECSVLFGVQPKRTMQIAQKLYENGYITYMRTDNALLGEEAIMKAEALIKKRYGEQYVKQIVQQKAQLKKDDKISQDAHECIRPTDFETQDLSEDYEAIERKIYSLIWKRAIQSAMSSAKGDIRTILFTADGDPAEYPWESSFKRTTFLGWKKIGASAVRLDEEDEDIDKSNTSASIWIQAINMKENDEIIWKNLEGTTSTVRIPSRYTEATLIRDLEKRGIGRPSTFASLVTVLFDKNYAIKQNSKAYDVSIPRYTISSLEQKWLPVKEIIKKKMGGEKDKMTPTPLGLTVVEFCIKEFPNLFQYDFTAKMESRLDDIVEGKDTKLKVCCDTWNSYKTHYDELKNRINTVTNDGKTDTDNKINNSKIREFKDGYKAVLTKKKGPLLLKETTIDGVKNVVYFGWPTGKSFNTLTEEDAMKFILVKKSEKEDPEIIGTHNELPIYKKKGPFGYYAQHNNINIPLLANETIDDIIQKIDIKKMNPFNYRLGEFEFRKGEYGTYVYKVSKNSTKKPAFVGLPDGLDVKTLTLEAIERIYKTGIERKKQYDKSKKDNKDNKDKNKIKV